MPGLWALVNERGFSSSHTKGKKVDSMRERVWCVCGEYAVAGYQVGPDLALSWTRGISYLFSLAQIVD